MSEPLTAVIAAGVAGGIAGAVEWFRKRRNKRLGAGDDVVENRPDPQLLEVLSAVQLLAQRTTELELQLDTLKAEQGLMRQDIATQLDRLQDSFGEIIKEQNRLAARFPMISDQIQQIRRDVREVRMVGNYVRHNTPVPMVLDESNDSPPDGVPK